MSPLAPGHARVGRDESGSVVRFTGTFIVGLEHDSTPHGPNQNSAYAFYDVPSDGRITNITMAASGQTAWVKQNPAGGTAWTQNGTLTAVGESGGRRSNWVLTAGSRSANLGDAQTPRILGGIPIDIADGLQLLQGDSFVLQIVNEAVLSRVTFTWSELND